MSRVHSFPPLSNEGASVLILGSMPGKASLRAGQYYAHPRNAFWGILAELCGFDAGWPYERRCAALSGQGVAVWDVLKTCTRSSSLDSDIDESSIVANDFTGFFAKHPGIQVVFFNGAMAEKSFLRHAQPTLDGVAADVRKVRLPSTSPANATYSFERKLAHWRVVVESLARAPARSGA